MSGTFAPNDPGVYQYVNFSSVRIRGAEAAAQFTLGNGFVANAAASYARGDVETNGVEAPLASIAVHSGGKDTSRAGLQCTPTCFVPGAFTVVDLLSWWKINDRVALRAGVFNVGNTKYWWWGDVRGLASTSTVKDAYSQPGRNATVSLAMQF